MPQSDPVRVPVFLCSDEGVQAFVERELWDIHPYSQSDYTKSMREVFEAARVQFGDYRCWDLIIYGH
jgi:hypothetical protein